MNFKKPSESQVKDTIAMAGGLVGGNMASKALFGFMHEATTATDAASIKKDENTVLLKRGGFALAGVALAACIDGKDTVTTIVKGVGYGIFVTQLVEGITILAKRSGVESETTASSTGKKALARAVGLGCPCTGDTYAPLNAAVDFAPRYDLSNMDHHYEEYTTDGLNGWGGSEEPGLLGWGSLNLQSA